jgi:hypothetical protein
MPNSFTPGISFSLLPLGIRLLTFKSLLSVCSPSINKAHPLEAGELVKLTIPPPMASRTSSIVSQVEKGAICRLGIRGGCIGYQLLAKCPLVGARHSARRRHQPAYPSVCCLFGATKTHKIKSNQGAGYCGIQKCGSFQKWHPRQVSFLYSARCFFGKLRHRRRHMCTALGAKIWSP